MNATDGIVVLTSEADAVSQISKKGLTRPSSMSQHHPSVQNQWLTSRMALLEAFSQTGRELSFADLVFNGHHCIRGHEDWVVSLAHTKGFAVVWLVPRQLGYCVGVDLEPRDRLLSPAVARRLRKEGDCDLDPIYLWSAKEAAYKSLPASIQNDRLLTDLIVKETSFHTIGSNCSGAWEQRLISDLICSFAWTHEPPHAI